MMRRAARPRLAAATHTRLLRRTGLSGLALLTAVPFAASANPEGGSVVSGKATITAGAKGELRIEQHSKRAAIDWQRFSIDKGEHTRFIQPSSDSVALNRVTGHDVSDIQGRLSANGSIYLINPNGIIFGPDARVDVGGLLATTSAIGNADFMAGHDHFSEFAIDGAGIVNEGVITVADGGLAALVAPWVVNQGQISAKLGRVELASADSFTLDLFGDGLIKMAIEDPAGHYGLEQLGKIGADGGSITLSAADAGHALNNVIKVDGSIEANAIAEHDGRIVLLGHGESHIDIAGELRADGSDQGSIVVSAASIDVRPTAELSASSAQGGGSIIIGGGRAGAAPTAGAATAKAVNVAAGAKIAANGREGGEVTVWGDDQAFVAGDLRASGTDKGGFIEISSRGDLGFVGTADVTGSGGAFVIDPENIRIVDGLGANDTEISDGSVLNGDGGDIDFVISTNAIASIDGDITLAASNNLTLEGTITLTRQGPEHVISLHGGNALSVIGSLDSGRAGVELTSGTGGLSLGEATITAPVMALDSAGDINLGGGVFDVGVMVGTAAGEVFGEAEQPGVAGVSARELDLFVSRSPLRRGATAHNLMRADELTAPLVAGAVAVRIADGDVNLQPGTFTAGGAGVFVQSGDIVADDGFADVFSIALIAGNGEIDVGRIPLTDNPARGLVGILASQRVNVRSSAIDSRDNVDVFVGGASITLEDSAITTGGSVTLSSTGDILAEDGSSNSVATSQPITLRAGGRVSAASSDEPLLIAGLDDAAPLDLNLELGDGSESSIARSTGDGTLNVATTAASSTDADLTVSATNIAIAGGAQIGALSVTGDTIDLADINANGDVTLDGATSDRNNSVTLNGAISTNGGDFVTTDGTAVRLAREDLVIDTRSAGASGDISFGGSLDGIANSPESLTILADDATLTFGDRVGDLQVIDQISYNNVQSLALTLNAEDIQTNPTQVVPLNLSIEPLTTPILGIRLTGVPDGVIITTAEGDILPNINGSVAVPGVTTLAGLQLQANQTEVINLILEVDVPTLNRSGPVVFDADSFGPDFDGSRDLDLFNVIQFDNAEPGISNNSATFAIDPSIQVPQLTLEQVRSQFDNRGSQISSPGTVGAGSNGLATALGRVRPLRRVDYWPLASQFDDAVQFIQTAAQARANAPEGAAVEDIPDQALETLRHKEVWIACPDAVDVPTAWQNTIADSAFNIDPVALPNSVNVFCDRRALIKQLNLSSQQKQ